MSILNFQIAGLVLFIPIVSLLIYWWAITMKYHELDGNIDEVKPSTDEKIEKFFQDNPDLPFVDVHGSWTVDIDGEMSLAELKALVRLMESLEDE